MDFVKMHIYRMPGSKWWGIQVHTKHFVYSGRVFRTFEEVIAEADILKQRCAMPIHLEARGYIKNPPSVSWRGKQFREADRTIPAISLVLQGATLRLADRTLSDVVILMAYSANVSEYVAMTEMLKLAPQLSYLVLDVDKFLRPGDQSDAITKAFKRKAQA